MNAFFGAELDLTNIAPPSFEPLPAGSYLAVCTEFNVEDRVNEKGEIKQANCRFQILEGPYSGRLVFQNISIIHHSEKAQAFGQGMLASWCDALDVDKSSLSSGDPLMNVPVGIKVKITPAREWNGKVYDARNEVQAFMPSDSVNGMAAPGPAVPKHVAAKPTPKPVAAAPAAPAAPSAAGNMPWNKLKA